jgi:hypothetical protein
MRPMAPVDSIQRLAVRIKLLRPLLFSNPIEFDGIAVAPCIHIFLKQNLQDMSDCARDRTSRIKRCTLVRALLRTLYKRMKVSFLA